MICIVLLCILSINQYYCQKHSSMIRSHSSKTRASRKSVSNSICLGNLQAFSIQLKPTSVSHQVSPKSHSQYLNARSYTSVGKTRASSAQVHNNSMVGTLPTKTYSSWVSCVNNIENKSQSDIKWIGVYKNLKPNEEVSRQAFPKRRQKVAQQSFANFMLQYGRHLKRSKQSYHFLQQAQNQINNSMNSSAATTKVKPRLTWFDRKNRVSFYRNERSNSKPRLQVVWKRHN